MSFARAFLIAAALALPVQAGCPVSSFGAEKAQDCARKACGPTRPSPEIQGIQRGPCFEYVSLDVMPAEVRVWLALDLDRGEVVYTQAYPARSYERLMQTRKQENAATRVSVRKVQKQSLLDAAK